MVKHRRARCLGFTLVELTISTAIMAVLMVGMMSAVLIASRALPNDNSLTSLVVRTGDVAAQMASELYVATSITENTPTAITFTVSDRGHGAAGPETIRYAWSGVAGDPLQRQYNGATAVDVLHDVQEFTLAYDLIAATPPPITTTEGPETLLSGQTTITTSADFSIQNKSWIGQCFQPTMPADAVSWKVTRVKVLARSNGPTNGITAVQLRLPAGGLPTTTVVDEMLMDEATLGTAYLWKPFSYNSASGLSPAQGLCLALVMNRTDTDLADIQYDAGSGSGLVITTNGENSWMSLAGQSMAYEVYGTITTGTQPPPTSGSLRSVQMTLREGSESFGRITTTAELLNRPNVP